jgi:hypothetical protein
MLEDWGSGAGISMKQRHAVGREQIASETEELTAFLEFYFDHFMAHGDVPPGRHPAKITRERAERAPKQALLGVRMAVGDCIEDSARWPAHKVKDADEALRAHGIPSLSEMRRRYSRHVLRVFKRGKIATEDEYYLVKAMADAASSPPDQAATLERLLAEYENAVTPRSAEASRSR